MPQVIGPGGPDRPRVLLVEDDNAVRRSLQLMLQACGYDVRAFPSGTLALSDPTVAEAACLVTDYRMAGMTGLDLLRSLRASGWQRPAILITAHRADYIAQPQDACFDAILEKPLLDRRLLACINEAIERFRN